MYCADYSSRNRKVVEVVVFSDSSSDRLYPVSGLGIAAVFQSACIYQCGHRPACTRWLSRPNSIYEYFPLFHEDPI